MKWFWLTVLVYSVVTVVLSSIQLVHLFRLHDQLRSPNAEIEPKRKQTDRSDR